MRALWSLLYADVVHVPNTGGLSIMLRTLVINTYAGSLLLGADALPGSRILGSFEDSGFGAENTKANVGRFRNLEPSFAFVDRIRDWPDLDLRDVVVLAHPPCAAFSQQNNSVAKRGVNTDAFECTVKVLKYAMSNAAAAIAVESVMGALGGAWDVHENMAELGGYHVYRILKNSILFGVPQFRERFWCVFVRKDLARPEMTWRCAPRFTTIAGTVDHLLPGTAMGLDKAIDKFIDRLSVGPCICGAVHGFDPNQLRKVGLESIRGYQRKGFARLITPVFFPELDYKVVCRRHVSSFASSQPSVLAPDGFAPVLLGSSLWVYKGNPLPAEAYKAIMGFPSDYIFPENRSHGVRTYLSKGVCPPVATWVLDNVRQHLGEPPSSEFTRGEAYVKTCRPGHIVSFRPGRLRVLDHYRAMSEGGVLEDTELLELRDEEAALEED